MMPPPVVQDPLPFHHHRSEPIEGVVIHCMGEYITMGETHRPAVEFLRHSKDLVDAKLSAHCLVSPGGTVVRCVPDGRVAYHAGVSDWNGRHNLNDWYLGMELLVAGEWEYTSFHRALRAGSITLPLAQLGAAAWQVATWMDQYDLDVGDVTRHSDVSPGRKHDPGKGFLMGDFMNQVAEWRGQFKLEERVDA